mmetsp:Transcript_49574/g.160290  ORF Transcript_49574/g.160290 Transcript_49574/m.160290 type:complete len:229 (+) Transcript_49574:397-1083(+)
MICIDGWLRSGSASWTTLASASMKSGSVPSVSTRAKEVMPACSATAASSRSISLSVPMCSNTNENGTRTSARVPSAPSCVMTSAVEGSVHGTADGPTCPWYESVCGLETPRARSSSDSSATPLSTWPRYGSPRNSTYLRGSPCAEYTTCAVCRSASGREASAFCTARADASTYPFRLNQEGTTVDFVGKPGVLYSIRSSTRSADPDVEMEKCGYSGSITSRVTFCAFI